MQSPSCPRSEPALLANGSAESVNQILQLFGRKVLAPSLHEPYKFLPCSSSQKNRYLLGRGAFSYDFFLINVTS